MSGEKYKKFWWLVLDVRSASISVLDCRTCFSNTCYHVWKEYPALDLPLPHTSFGLMDIMQDNYSNGYLMLQIRKKEDC
jgi:hypothetical protein